MCLDWALGEGCRRLTQRLHFHPDVCVEIVKEDTARLWFEGDSAVMLMRFVGKGSFSREQGWYCPRFGVRVANQVVRWETECELPNGCGWILSYERESVEESDHEIHEEHENRSR